VLENLKPAPRIEQSPLGPVAVEFDGAEGTATTNGLADGVDFLDFLEEAGYSADKYEVVGNPRTSRWQRYDGASDQVRHYAPTLNGALTKKVIEFS